MSAIGKVQERLSFVIEDLTVQAAQLMGDWFTDKEKSGNLLLATNLSRISRLLERILREDKAGGYESSLVMTAHPVPTSCLEEPCGPCYRMGVAKPSAHKIEEVVLGGEVKHPLSQFLCCFHFSVIMGGLSEKCGVRE